MNGPHIVTAELAALVAAPFVGSLLGVLIRRLPRGRPVVLARSACETCGHLLAPRDLVPVASYLALRGRCRHCGAPIGRFHPTVELAALAVPAILVLAGMTDPAGLIAGCALGYTLLALGWIDATTFMLPDALTLPLLLAGLVDAWITVPASLADRAAAAILGYASLRLLAICYRRLRGREGLGQGDAKLLAAGGAWTGLHGLAPILLAASVLGLLLAGARKLTGRSVTLSTRLPFGAPLALAIWLAWLATG